MPADSKLSTLDTCLVCEGTGEIVFGIALGVVGLVPCPACEGKGVRITPAVYDKPKR